MGKKAEGLKSGLADTDGKGGGNSWKNINQNLPKPERDLGPVEEDTPWLPQVEEGKTGIGAVRDWLWKFFEDPEGNLASHYINLYVLGLILAGAVITVVETVPKIHNTNEDLFYGIEFFFVMNFSLEFVLRLISCPDYCAFSSNFMNWIDCVSIIPFYLELALSNTGINLQVLRVLRTGRALRMVKLGRYSSGIRLVQNSLISSLDALQLALVILVVLVIVFASAIYYTERGKLTNVLTGCANGTKPIEPCLVKETSVTQTCCFWYIRTEDTNYGKEGVSPFQSIPDSFWWAIVTMVTVGYGDVMPATGSGQLFGVLSQLTGVIMLALPLSIVGASFHEEMQNMALERELEQQKNMPEEENNERGALETIDDLLENSEEYGKTLEAVLIIATQCACTAVDLSKGTWNVLSPDVELMPRPLTPDGAEVALEMATFPPGRSSPPDAVCDETVLGTYDTVGAAGQEYRKVTLDPLDSLQAKVDHLLAAFEKMYADLA